MPTDTERPVLFKSRRTVNAGLEYNSTDYYVYDGNAKGFHYDLANYFARSTGYNSDYTAINNSRQDSRRFLEDRKGNYIAANLSPLKNDTNLLYSDPLFKSSLVVVSHKNTVGKKGKIVLVPKESYAAELLKRQHNYLRYWFYVVEQDGFSHEDILLQVDKGGIFSTVAYGHIAKALTGSMHNLKITDTIISNIPVCWAFNKNDDSLRSSFNAWLQKARKKGDVSYLYKRYYENRRTPDKYRKIRQNGISRFDHIFQKEARKLGWDWELLAAIAHTESKFNDTVVSSHNAYGLMQIMEESARQFKVIDYFRPDSNIYVAVRYLEYLDNLFQTRILNPKERINFVLASYNAGWGHIEDAIRLAEEFGYPPDQWKNSVENFLEIKSLPEYSGSPAVKNGYCNARQIIDFVNKVKAKYKHYLNKKMFGSISCEYCF